MIQHVFLILTSWKHRRTLLEQKVTNTNLPFTSEVFLLVHIEFYKVFIVFYTMVVSTWM